MYASASVTPRGVRSKVEFTVIQSVDGVRVSTGGEIVIETGLRVGEDETLFTVIFTEPEESIRTGIRTSFTPP